MYWELFLEFATPPTERLPCRRCGVALAMDEPCVSSGVFTAVEGVPGRGASKNMHARCAVDLDAEAVVRLLDRDPLEFVGRAAIDALARARVAAITAANKKRKKPDTTEAPVVERARDPLGRPRVRVLFTGPASPQTPHVVQPPFSHTKRSSQPQHPRVQPRAVPREQSGGWRFVQPGPPYAPGGTTRPESLGGIDASCTGGGGSASGSSWRPGHVRSSSQVWSSLHK